MESVLQTYMTLSVRSVTYFCVFRSTFSAREKGNFKFETFLCKWLFTSTCFMVDGDVSFSVSDFSNLYFC